MLTRLFDPISLALHRAAGPRSRGIACLRRRVHVWRDALCDAVLPTPEGWPSLSTADRRAFWARFDDAAPLHLRVATMLAAVFFGLSTGPPGARLAWAERTAGLGELLEVSKVVACLRYFHADVAQAFVRSSR